jgi:hypothetical protein
MPFIRALLRSSALRFRDLALSIKSTATSRFRAVRWVVDLLLLPSDYYAIRDTWVYDSPPNLIRPKGFAETMQAWKLFNRRAHHVRLADKLAVRDFVAERVGQELLPELYWSGVDIEDLRSQALPNRFVLKSNHACRTVRIVQDLLEFDWLEAERCCSDWLTIDYSLLFAEWQYRWIPPRIFAEELLEDSTGAAPMEYRFLCFHVTCPTVRYHTLC